MNGDDGQRIVKIAFSLCEEWKLSHDESCKILGMNNGSDDTVSAGSDTYRRIKDLFEISVNLQVLLPHNPDLRQAWLSGDNKAFDNQKPIQVILQEGDAGLVKVRDYLRNCVDPSY